MNQALRVGVAETSINPGPGTQIDGNIGVRRPASFILSDLYARAIAFSQGERRFLLLTLDLLAVTKEWTDAIRDFAAAELGFDRDAVAVHALQNHSSPALGHMMLGDRLEAARKYPWIRGSDPAYGPLVFDRLKPIIRAAATEQQPVRLLFGSSVEARCAFNRRTVMRDGTARMCQDELPAEALCREGPMDPEVGFALFANESLQAVAALLHHTCHPVHWEPHTAVHGDWPGAWAQALRERMFPGVIPLVLNGCCGNIHHADAYNPDREDTPRSMAALLTAAVERALANPCFGDEAPLLAFKTVRFDIPYRQFPAKIFEDARDLIGKHPEPLWIDGTRSRFEWDWAFAASLVELEERLAREQAFEYEIQALRLGDLSILVLPGEPFVEAQLEIKRRSPARRTFIAHMSNFYVGYIPTPAAILRGGFETRPSGASKLAPEALQMITDRAVALLGELYP
jgi:neutral ceramidase